MDSNQNQNQNYQGQNNNYYQNQSYQGQNNNYYQNQSYQGQNNNYYQNQSYQGQNNNYYQNQGYQGQNNNYYQNQSYQGQNNNYYQNQNYQNNPYASSGYTYQENPAATSNVMTKTFLYMVIALSLSTIAALFAARMLQMGRFSDFYALMIGAFVVEIVSLIAGNCALSKGNPLVGGISFVIYSLANGVTLSTIFVVYQIGSIVTTFVGCAVVFGIMAVIGFVTKKDLSGIGNLCLIVLIGVIVTTLLNFIFKSTGVDYLISYVGVVLFAGLTAYDTQRIKKMAQTGVNADVIGLWGALELYLDFINLFLYLLKIFAKRNN